MTVLIAGGGIAGLALGLTLNQIGVPFRIFETTREIRPLGVGINLQPNAVRELFDLGLEPDLERIGVQTRQIGFHSKHGHLIWQEPRGRRAGYAWPQYSVHRGHLQMMLHETLIARAGPDCLRTGARVSGYSNQAGSARLHLQDGSTETGALVIGADGIHSALRAQMYPDEGAPIWNGQVLWRATTRAPVYFGGAAMVMIGHDSLRLVSYPITEPDPETGLATINWIAEKRFDPALGWQREDWNRPADIADFIDDFMDWRFDWIDVPALIRGADRVLEYPMVDRDPLPRWTDGGVTLMGDAAHPTYPVGSNGASQAIIDARVIGASLLEHGLSPAALTAYEAEIRPVTTRVGLANRGSGPDAILQQVEDLCAGRFDDISDVIPLQTLQDHSDKYKALAGFSIEDLNAKPPIIQAGARIG
ncbi:flavin-dependent oxidoreductase [Rhodobacteraceae bacterium F11138]|nr:flavin-dependent oxidoreductase [Rhodobacteraceae bacterium F11138]